MADLRDLENDLGRELQQLREFYRVDLPRYAAQQLEKLVDDSFKAEQYQGDSKSKWAPRKPTKANASDRTKNGKVKARKNRRAIMVETGDLLASTTAEINNGPEITVSIGTDKVYGQIHNEGLPGRAWGKYPFKMPQRQFMPIPGTEETTLSVDLERYTDQNLDRIFS